MWTYPKHHCDRLRVVQQLDGHVVLGLAQEAGGALHAPEQFGLEAQEGGVQRVGRAPVHLLLHGLRALVDGAALVQLVVDQQVSDFRRRLLLKLNLLNLLLTNSVRLPTVEVVSRLDASDGNDAGGPVRSADHAPPGGCGVNTSVQTDARGVKKWVRSGGRCANRQAD